MDHARHGLRKQAWIIVLVVAMGCSALQPRAITGAKAQAVRDTVTSLENAMNLAVDRLDCAAGFDLIGDREPMFVSSGHVVRKRAAFRDACETMIAPRTGAVFVVDTLSVHALSPDAAYVVREGVYTIKLKDGTSRREYLVMTTIWARQNGAWKMVHLHESSRALPPQSVASVRQSSQDIDADVWAVASATVAEGDAVGMGRIYHPDAVLVSASRTSSIADALVRWGDGMAKAKREGGRSTVAFRFAKRQDNASTAFESGIFKLTDFDRAGARTVAFIPFEVLLVKKDGKWRILMERQFANVDEGAWGKLTP